MSEFVCGHCKDTHLMPLEGRYVPCTRCPTPCKECRKGGRGAFCEETPCPCECHKRVQPSKVLVSDGKNSATVHLYPQRRLFNEKGELHRSDTLHPQPMEGVASWVTRSDQQHPAPAGENGTQQVVTELFARLDALEKRVAELEGQSAPADPCKHDALGRCIHVVWGEEQAEFRPGIQAWVCRKCNSPIVAPAQASVVCRTDVEGK